LPVIFISRGLLGLANDKGERVKELIASEGIEFNTFYQKPVTTLLDWRGGLFYRATAKAINTDIIIQVTLKREKDDESSSASEEPPSKARRIADSKVATPTPKF
jgi:hypothetical protein